MGKFINFIFLFILSFIGFKIHPLLGGVIFLGVLASLNNLFSNKKAEHNPYENYKGNSITRTTRSNFKEDNIRKPTINSDNSFHNKKFNNEIAASKEKIHDYDDDEREYHYENNYLENYEKELEDRERRSHQRGEKRRGISSSRRKKENERSGR